MAMEVELHKRGISLTSLEEERIQRHTKSLEKRVEKFPDPRLELAIEDQASPRGVRVDLRLALGPLGGPRPRVPLEPRDTDGAAEPHAIVGKAL